jgi:hypothetical protein
MKEHPILFSAPMVRALLDGSKTQTRRVVKHTISGPNPPGQTFDWRDAKGKWVGAHGHGFEFSKTNAAVLCPYGQPGNRLWVRESLLCDSERGHYYAATAPGSLGNPSGRTYVDYDNETPANGLPARPIPSIHMPRWASRITLEVTGVRVERLQDISTSDALAEGLELSHIDSLKRQQWRMYPHKDGTPGPDGEIVVYHGKAHTSKPIESYRSLWLSINGPGSWDTNPWVWVVEFRRLA